MPYFAVKDANGDIIYVAATGAGTTGDPYVPTRTFTNSIPAGTAVIGKVDQGTGGVSAWKVDGSGVTQPVSAASLPLPTGAATAANQTTANASLSSIDGKFPTQGQALAAASLPVVLPAAQLTTLTPPAAITGFATETTLASVLTQSDFDTKVGSLTETAPATDTASSGLNGRAQRIAQRLTSLIALLPSAIGQNAKSNSLSVVTASDDDMVGSKTETAPASDTASSGLNGRAQRIAQNITSMIARLPAALGQTTKSASLPVVLPSDYQAPIVPANVSPAWTNIGANNTDGVASMDVTNYRSGSVQLTGTFSATVQVQFSNDGGTTWVAQQVYGINGANAFGTGMLVPNLYFFVVPAAALMRIRTTSYGSGTVVGAVVLSSLPATTWAMSASAADFVGLADGASNTITTANSSLGVLKQATFGHSYNGSTWDRVRVITFFVDLNAVSITSIATVWTPTSGKKFRLIGGSISVSAAASVLFEDNAAGTTIHRTPKLLADTPYYFSLGNGKISAATNNVLKATSSAAATITGTLFGTEE